MSWPLKDMGIESYAIAHQALHPTLAMMLHRIGWFTLREVSAVRVRVLPQRHPAFWKGLSDSGPVGFFVAGRWIVAAEGFLNKPKDSHPFGQNCDLTTSWGFAQMAHEVFHVKQYIQRGAGWLLAQGLVDAVRSWQSVRRAWDHRASAIEQEAMAFERAVQARAQRQVSSLVDLFDQLR